MVMAVKDRLASDLSDIDADVEASDGWVPGQNVLPLRTHQPLDGNRFVLGKIEKGGDMTSWKNQCMEGRHWVDITQSKSEVILCDDFRWVDVTENTGIALAGRGHGVVLAGPDMLSNSVLKASSAPD